MAKVPPKLRLIAAILAVGWAQAFLVMRLFRLELAPFIWDEPYFQILIDWLLHAHVIPSTSQPGNAGISYGPTAIWFFMVLRKFTDRIEVLIGAHAAFFSAGMLVMTLVLRKYFGTACALLALLLMATSPLFFMFSRMAWDNTFLVPLTALLLALTFKGIELDAGASRRRIVALFVGWGLTAGLLFNTHLMSIPFILVMATVVAVKTWRKPVVAKYAAAGMIAGFLVVTAIYLPTIFQSLSRLKRAGGQGSPPTTPPLYMFYAPFSTQVMGLYFESLLEKLRFLPFDPGKLLFFVSLFVVAWRWRLRPPLIFAAATIAMLATTALTSFLRIDITRPHYFNPVWTFPVLLMATAWAGAGGKQKALLATLVIATALNHSVLITKAAAHIATEGGIRNMHYGTTLVEQRKLIEKVCYEARMTRNRKMKLDLDKVGSVFGPALKWHFDHHPTCRGTGLDFGPGGLRVRYPETTPTSARLTY